MGLLGAQLVITLVTVSIMQKIGNVSFARWLLCSQGLYRYIHPDNNELKRLAGISLERPKGRRGGDNEANERSETFHIPTNLNIQLQTAPVKASEVARLWFYSEYIWIMDFALHSCIVFLLSEIYNWTFNVKDDCSLSTLWCLFSVIFSFNILFLLTKEYFTTDSSISERSICIVAFFIFLLMAMMVLIVDDSILEVGLDEAYDSFNENAVQFLKKQGLNSDGPASRLILKLSIAIWAAVIGTLLTFPGLRVARMNWDSKRHYRETKFGTLILNLNYALPFIVVLMWVKPVTRHYLTVRVFNGMTEPLMSSHQFDSMRLILIIITMVLRIILMPRQLQAYLDMAHSKIERQKKEAGRTTNKEVQQKVASVYYFLCVVALQYLCPLLMCINLTLLYKTLGAYSWNGTEVEQVSPGLIPTDNMEQFQMALENLKMLFSTVVYRGVLGFCTWWCCFAYFITTSFGTMYQSYFSAS